MIKTIFSLIDRKRRKQALLLLPVMLVGSLLEMLGIGMVVSACAMLISDTWLQSDPTVLWICGLLRIQPGRELVIWCFVAMIGLYIFKALYLAWENLAVAKFVRTSRSETASAMFRRIIRAPYTFFVRHGTAEIHNLLGRDMDHLGTGLNACMQLMLEGLVVLGMGVLLLMIDPGMTLCLLAGLAVLMLIVRLFLNRAIYRAAEYQRAANKQRWKWFHQTVVGIKDIRIGQHEDFFSAHFEENESSFARAEYLKQFWAKLPFLCIETVMVMSILIYLLLLALGGRDLSRYVPGLSALALTALRLLPSCSRINSSLTQIGYARSSLEAICRAIDELDAAPAAELPGETVAFDRGISVRGLTYGYEGGPGEVLRDVDLDIPAGASVGIVGPSGAGKTTLLDILLGLLTPERGQVLIDGVPIGRCYGSYLKKVAYVPQSIFLLDDTVRSNIAIGEEPGDIDDSRVWHALEQTALDRMIRSLPEGLDTRVGERGLRFSGGECQRLGLARALYREPSVIVLDEATSALDVETERAVLASVEKLRSGRTLIVVSHRQSAIEHCDIIYRVDGGSVKKELP